MISRLLATLVMLLLAFLAFWSNALNGGYFTTITGFLFLFLAVLVWFAWKPIMGGLREAVPTPTGWGLGAPAPLPPSSKLESREAALTPIGWRFGAPAPHPANAGSK